MIPTTSDVERALRTLLDTSNTIAVLFDEKYRLLYSSPKHRALLRLEASELYNRPFYKLQSQSQAALVEAVGGPRGWFRNGILRTEYTLLRMPFENARNLRASAQYGGAWTIREGLESPLVLGISNEIPIDQYRPQHHVFRTLDDPIA